MVALVGVVLSSVLVGLMLAVMLSLLFVLYRASRAYVAVLGRVPGKLAAYGDIGRHPEYERVPGLVIFRLDAPLFFANASVADKEIRQVVAKQPTPPNAILIDLGATNDMDVASADMLHDLVSEMRDANIQVLLAQVRGGVRDQMRRMGLMAFVGQGNVFFSVEGAVAHYMKTDASAQNAAEEQPAQSETRPTATPPESALAEGEPERKG